MSQEHSPSKPQLDAEQQEPTPVISWEQPEPHRTKDTGVIPLDAHRRQGAAQVLTEATVTVRELHTMNVESPVRLIVVSSGFGQKQRVHVPTIQAKAAA
ncbi:hypothetical protein ABE504_14335 [Paenibacillus oryzisoli]|uniref:hypothetical protein n=1 Tax=Paenibacillus oryzisoli TaxID=1850517 RepID=UPI003D28F74E